MARTKTFCPTCGQATNSRRTTLNAKHVEGLRFAAGFDPEPMPLHALGRHFGGTNSTVYQAFYECRYFGLTMHPVDDAGKDILGVWLLTDLGRWFLADWEDVPRWVEIFDNRVVEMATDKVGITKIPNIKVDHDYAVSQMRAATVDEVTANAKRRA